MCVSVCCVFLLAVRKALADMCVDVAAKVGPEAVAQHMSDLVVKCLTDEDAAVKLRVLNKITVIASRVPTLLNRLSATLKTLYTDQSWRVRKQISLSMPSVMKSLGPEFFQEHFLSAYLASLKDSVAEVRLGTASTLPFLISSSTPLWVTEKVFPTVKALGSDDQMSRLTMLACMRSMLTGDLPDRLQSECVGLLLTASSDVVANVRLAAAIILGEASRKLSGDSSVAIMSQIRPVLTELAGDKDKDVKYFAAESLKNCR
jgi:hypothetical protein